MFEAYLVLVRRTLSEKFVTAIPSLAGEAVGS